MMLEIRFTNTLFERKHQPFGPDGQLLPVAAVAKAHAQAAAEDEERPPDDPRAQQPQKPKWQSAQSTPALPAHSCRPLEAC